jgi:protein-S-isoprenylcysteine O-methyltransferase Ste14
METPAAPYNLLHAIAFKIRGLAMVPAFLFLGLWPYAQWEHQVLAVATGLPVFFLGLGIRVWSQTYLRYRIRCEHTLATGGPYAWMRNPVYIGNLLMFAGLCLMCRLPWAIPIICGLGALVYHLSVQFEESRLTKRFGESYLEYCRKTPRWIPRRPAPAAAPESVTTVSLGQACRVEWHCLLLLLIPVAKEVAGPLLRLKTGS